MTLTMVFKQPQVGGNDPQDSHAGIAHDTVYSHLKMHATNLSNIAALGQNLNALNTITISI